MTGHAVLFQVVLDVGDVRTARALEVLLTGVDEFVNLKLVFAAKFLTADSARYGGF